MLPPSESVKDIPGHQILITKEIYYLLGGGGRGAAKADSKQRQQAQETKEVLFTGVGF